MGEFKIVGFKDVSVSIVPFVDQSGSALNVLNNMASYIDTFETLPKARVRLLMEDVEKAVNDGTFLFCLPQFLVTASLEN